MLPSLILMPLMWSTYYFSSFTGTTVDNTTDFSSTFLVHDDGTGDDNNIDTIRLMISSPTIATSLYIFDVTDNTDTVLTVTPRFLVHVQVQVTFQVRTQVGVQVPYQVHVQVSFQEMFQVSPQVLFQAIHFLIQVLIHQVLFPFLIRVFLLLFDKTLSTLLTMLKTTIPSILYYCWFHPWQSQHRCTFLTSPTTAIPSLPTHHFFITDTFPRYARCCSKKRS